MWLFFFLVVLLVLAFYRFFTAKYDYWKKRGVLSPPVSIIFGNLKDSIFVKKNLAELFMDIYNEYSHLPYIGVYKMRQPALLIRDPDLLKEVFIKEFSSFRDNDFVIDEKVDPMMANNIFSLKGDRWKTVRTQLTPSYSHKRVKLVLPLIENVGNNLVKFLNESEDAYSSDGIDAKELSAKFTTDVVASCAFGLEGKSFEDPHAEFRTIGNKLLTPSLGTALKHLCVMIVPSLAKILRVKFFPDEVSNYFRQLVKECLKYREENGISRGDFLDIMKELKLKLGENEFSDEDIAVHAAGFFADGYETSSLSLSFTLYELAANPHIQTKLRGEIDEMLAKNNGTFDYETLHSIEYLDNVLMESLRKYPIGAVLSRVCTKEYTLPSQIENKPDVLVEVGTPIVLPIYAIHKDPKYYPDPEKFDPDRFLSENRQSRPSCTFLGFGEGPRTCIGQRFGLTQIKVAVVKMLSNFEIRLNSKTQTPLEMDPMYFLLKSKDNIWLNFSKRK